MINPSAASTFELPDLGGIDTRLYRPIHRLASNVDLEYLAAQPGTTKQMIDEIRRERLRVLYLYIKELRTDAIRAWRSESSVMGERIFATRAICRRVTLELTILRIGVVAGLHIEGWRKVDLKTIQLLLDLLKSRLAALEATYSARLVQTPTP